jgi:hypothetical protein
MAAKEIVDRAYGKPAQAKSGDDEDRKVTIVIRPLEAGVLSAALQLLSHHG